MHMARWCTPQENKNDPNIYPNAAPHSLSMPVNSSLQQTQATASNMQPSTPGNGRISLLVWPAGGITAVCFPVHPPAAAVTPRPPFPPLRRLR